MAEYLTQVKARRLALNVTCAFVSRTLARLYFLIEKIEEVI